VSEDMRTFLKMLTQAEKRLREAQDMLNQAHLYYLKHRLVVSDTANKMLYEIYVALGCLRRLLGVALEVLTAEAYG